VNFFRHQNWGQHEGVYSAIVKNLREVENTLYQATTVGPGPEQPRV
jgi:hypothetical protein